MSVVSDYFEKTKLDEIEDQLEDFTKQLEEISKDMKKDDSDEEEIVVTDEKVEPENQETTESLKKLKDSLEAYSKMTSGSSAKVYRGQNLVGTPSSMSPYGPMSRITPPASPLFSDLQSTQRGALQNLNTQLTALQKLLRGGVNV